MKRIQLFEFEDFSWFPSWLRACMTNLIVVLQRLMGVPQVLANLVVKVLDTHGITHIVDLGSGSGGVMPDVIEVLDQTAESKGITLTMTDLYPNPEQLKKFNNPKHDRIKYNKNAVDATNIASAPEGLKTMINCFHHMPPKKARSILDSAQRTHQPFLVYEMGENNIPLLLWWLLLPLSLILLIIMVLFMTPLVKPLTWRQIVFTYLIPIIPICYAWDGQASLPRMYSMDDLEVLLQGLGNKNYRWEKGYAKKKNGKKLGTYVLGSPINNN